MFAFGKSPTTGQAWRESLARRLAWAFPEGQAKEILTDYQEQFETGKERGKSESEIIEALGTPSEAISQLLEEDPSTRMDLLRHGLLWGAALALCWAFVWLSFLGTMNTTFLLGVSLFLPVSSAVLFMLVRAPARITLERMAAPEKRVSPVRIFPVPLVLMLIYLVTQELLVIRFVRFRDVPLKWIRPQNIGPITVMALQLLALAMALLAAWMLFRSITSSIRYFPGIAHAGGASFSALAMSSVYTSMEMGPDSPLELQILLGLIPYLAGLITARVFQHWVDGSKPLPHCFRDKNVIWADWRHRLAVSLLGWFSTEQAIEILEDYQEQFELAREQGRTEPNILSEMGRPATVVRDLLAEDRKARLRRRKMRIWAALAFLAGWLLLGLVQTFEFGHSWPGMVLFCDFRIQVGVITVVLGTVSLFVLLHVRERAAVERRFPTEKKPTVWLFLLPFVIAALLNGFVLYLCAFPWRISMPVRFCVVVWTEYSVLILCVLMVWALARCFSGSIRYLPAAIHAIGCACCVLCMGLFCSHLDFEGMFGRLLYIWFLPNLLPYAISVILALAVWLVIHRDPRKEG